mmetsp:Transcript_6441/g.20125  ORF Transcript_6441/g.20125 Transcript_6441/m.20125 type:complete len:436 (-) Transcript_6441:284-1591(-)|eukprot:CAMPEP_0198660142 /NCGR_PEP_ID=MMETSP1467-20131203/35299_1 /TAXON_ID=1462469 /ORGANISM="unid. sp., Strain CCMP2135" /LENGTH=435 /DNA_ID=CAMNT_0044396543 /DNA_START=9 /DNA_END=1316 /DNA_ORIENTATION=+
MRRHIHVCLLLVAALVRSDDEVAEEDDLCVFPGTCAPPRKSVYPFSSVMPVVPRHQWEINGGYCGAMSVQAIAMSLGAWMSQSVIRQAAPSGGGHGDPLNGYELLNTNTGAALEALGLSYEAFDTTLHQPQSNAYLEWMKRKLAEGSPVIWFIMCAGDAHDAYGLGPFDHIEPVFGIYSKSSLADPVREDDILVHSSDYAPDGPRNLGYYRRFDTLVDAMEMTGNCSDAQAPHGLNEAYPCLNVNQNFGFAVTGFARGPTVPLSIEVDNIDEPCTPCGEDPIPTTATVTIPNLAPQQGYLLYRFDRGNAIVPSDVEDYPAAADWVLAFVAGLSTQGSDTLVWTDSHAFSSDSTIAYRCVEDDSLAFRASSEELSWRRPADFFSRAPEIGGAINADLPTKVQAMLSQHRHHLSDAGVKKASYLLRKTFGRRLRGPA